MLNLSLAPRLVAVEERTKVSFGNLESILEASAESSPLFVVVAVLPLRLRSRERRSVLVVPLAPVVSSKTGNAKLLAVEGRLLASTVLNLEDISKSSPALIDDSLGELNLVVSPVIRVVESISVGAIDPPLVTVTGRVKGIAGDGATSVCSTSLGVEASALGRDDTVGLEGARKNEELELTVKSIGLDGKRGGNALRESTVLASSDEDSMIALNKLNSLKKVVLISLNKLSKSRADVTELNESVVRSLRRCQSLAELSGEIKSSTKTSMDETNSYTSIARNETSEHGDDAEGGAENVHEAAGGGVGFDGGSNLSDDGVDGLAGEGGAVAEGAGVLIEELVDSVDVPEGVKLLVGVILGNILGVEGRASVAGDQVAGKTSEAVELKVALSETKFVAVGLGSILGDPVIDVLLHVQGLPAFWLQTSRRRRRAVNSRVSRAIILTLNQRDRRNDRGKRKRQQRCCKNRHDERMTSQNNQKRLYVTSSEK